jgi:hypothetical protein
VILSIIWWLQKLGKDWQSVIKEQKTLMWKDTYNLRKLSELEDKEEYQTKISKSLQLWRT